MTASAKDKFPSVKYIYDRYKKASPSKMAAVELRITYNRQQKYISTNISVYPDQWNSGIIINTPDASQLNKMLDKLLLDVRQILFDMFSEGEIDIFAVPERLEKNQKDSPSFLQFCEKRIKVRKYGKNKDTQQRYDRFFKFFKRWGKIKKFEDISAEAIIAYDKHLQKKGMQPQSKWHNYHRFLNSFITDAIEDGLIRRNPYKWVSIDKGPKESELKRHLSIQEFIQIQEVKLQTKSLERVKDLFVFQTFTCLSYSDLKNLDIKKIKEVKKVKVYIGKRKKTHEEFTIPLLPPALKILDKYDNILPVISNTKYNEYLKVVAQAAGIDKPVSSHWARHTGATLLLNKGVSMQVVAKICGHSSTKITEQVYAKLLDETVVDAIKGLDKQ